MMFLRASTAIRTTVTLATILLLLGAFLSFAHPVMAMTVGTTASDCLLMSQEALCPMSPIGHLAAWQNSFTATIPTTVYALTLTLAFFVAYKAYRALLDTISVPQLTLRRFFFTSFLHDPLALAFARGILNPRIW